MFLFLALVGSVAVLVALWASVYLLRAAVNTRAGLHYGPGQQGGWEYCAIEWCKHPKWRGRPRHPRVSDEEAEALERQVRRLWLWGTVLCGVNAVVAGLLVAATVAWHGEPWMGMGGGAPVWPIVVIVGAFVVWPWATRIVAAGRLAESQPIGANMIYQDGSSS